MYVCIRKSPLSFINMLVFECHLSVEKHLRMDVPEHLWVALGLLIISAGKYTSSIVDHIQHQDIIKLKVKREF